MRLTQRPEREIIEIECKSVLNRVVSQKMPFKWSVNPYRGCEHKCVYCYARRYHTFFDLNPGADFENKIFVKVNAPQVLRRELSRKSWQREHVAIGTAVDPYQPVEGKYRLTRAILKALLDYWTPCSIITKNTMLLRDIDLLSELWPRAGLKVLLSITTLDKALAQRLEPDTPPPEKRLEALSRLMEAGHPRRRHGGADPAGAYRRPRTRAPGRRSLHAVEPALSSGASCASTRASKRYFTVFWRICAPVAFNVRAHVSGRLRPRRVRSPHRLPPVEVGASGEHEKAKSGARAEAALRLPAGNGVARLPGDLPSPRCHFIFNCDEKEKRVRHP